MVGVVTHKHPEYYRVDINAPELATLRYLIHIHQYKQTHLFSAMAFESATKRNRVTVQVGDLGQSASFFHIHMAPNILSLDCISTHA